MEVMSRLLLAHEHQIRSIEASPAFDLTVVQEDLKAEFYNLRVAWDTKFKGEKMPSPSKRAITHAHLLKITEQWTLPGEVVTLRNLVVSYNETIISEAGD